MFIWHDTVRRRICRAAFLLFGVAPTLLVVGLIVWFLSARQHRAHEVALGEAFGLKAKVSRVSFPRPGLTLYEDLRLADPETGAMVAAARTLAVEETGETILVIPTQPVVEGAQLAPLWQALERRLRQGPTAASLRLAQCDVTLNLPDGGMTLKNIEGSIAPVKNGLLAALSFCDTKTSAPLAQLRIRRTREASGPTTLMELKTGELPVPCRLAAPLWPAVAELGPDSTLLGFIWARQTGDEWSGGMNGQIARVDLNRLITSRYPRNKLSGSADFDFQEMFFENGRLKRATGRLDAEAGSIGAPLIDSAIANLGFERGRATFTGRYGSIPYAKLALDFTIDPSRGLDIKGGRLDQAPGAVLVDKENTPILLQPTEDKPVVNLVRMLVPANDIQAPATSETEALIHWLPLPHIVVANQSGLPPRAVISSGPKK